MINKITVEVCCASLDDALEAQKGGADRIELNGSLIEGGLTPSLGLLAECKSVLKIPIIAMVRPRRGGFCYSDNEIKTMLRDAELLMKNHADGIAFGFLKRDGRIDIPLCKDMLSIIGSGESVFHRAIDVSADSFAGLEELHRLNVTRILTSGRHATAIEGAANIKKMCKQADGRIEILACGKIRADNVERVLETTGCGGIHFACFKEKSDPIQSESVKFNGAGIPENIYSIADYEGIAEIIKTIDDYEGRNN